MSSCRSVPEDNDRDVSIHSLSAIKDSLTEWLARLDGYACAMSTRNKAAKASEMKHPPKRLRRLSPEEGATYGPAKPDPSRQLAYACFIGRGCRDCGMEN